MSVQWQPTTMLEFLFTQLDIGQKFAADHDAISDKTILWMAIENIQKSGMLDITLRYWALQTTQYSWGDFTFFMYKADKYRRDTPEKTGSSGFSSNFHGITSEDVSYPPSLATVSTLDISELASAFSLDADAQTAQITALVAVTMNQRLLDNTNKTWRNSARQEGTGKGKRSEKTKSYCWTHGVTTNMEHDSGTCDNQHTDHQNAATFNNCMGGSDHTCGSGRNHSGPRPAN